MMIGIESMPFFCVSCNISEAHCKAHPQRGPSLAKCARLTRPQCRSRFFPRILSPMMAMPLDGVCQQYADVMKLRWASVCLIAVDATSKVTNMKASIDDCERLAHPLRRAWSA
jgi:hypothetical protein